MSLFFFVGMKDRKQSKIKRTINSKNISTNTINLSIIDLFLNHQKHLSEHLSNLYK